MKRCPEDRNVGAARIYVVIAVVIFSIGLFVHPLQAQHPITDISAMAGPWECRDTAGIHGISVIAIQNLITQSIGFRVYQRQGEQEHWGYFYTSDANGVVALDGNHLAIHLKNSTEIPPFDLDLRFDPDKQRWTGMWSLCNTPSGAVLERPHPGEGAPANPLIGDWKGSQEPKMENVHNGAPEAASTLHIRQSLDGKLIGWVDVLANQLGLSSTQHNGEEVLFRPADQKTVSFGIYDSVPTVHAEYSYEGTLSADGKTITGKWRISGGGVMTIGGGETQVPTVFRRVN